MRSRCKDCAVSIIIYIYWFKLIIKRRKEGSLSHFFLIEYILSINKKKCLYSMESKRGIFLYYFYYKGVEAGRLTFEILKQWAIKSRVNLSPWVRNPSCQNFITETVQNPLSLVNLLYFVCQRQSCYISINSFSFSFYCVCNLHSSKCS